MEQRVLKVLSKVFRVPVESLNMGSSPDSVPQWDSLAHMNMVLAVEEEFGVSFSAEELVSLLNVELVVETLKAKGVK